MSVLPDTVSMQLLDDAAYYCTDSCEFEKSKACLAQKIKDLFTAIIAKGYGLLAVNTAAFLEVNR